MSRTKVGTLIVALSAATVIACSDKGPLAPSAVRADDAAAVLADGDASGGVSANATAGPEYANVSNQGGGGIYVVDGASLVRQPNGLRASLSVPTPESGTYNYPAGRVPGHPEVFTLWGFVFNYPNLCSAPCNADDLGVNTPAKGGVYNIGGHFASGNQITISGRIGVGETPFNHAPLESPSTAEVHLALAPHGAVDRAKLPDEFRTPTGPMSFWWIAVFP